jgi:hypothetical protein
MYAATYNLKLDALSVEFNCSDLEVYANGRDERRRPCIVTEAQQET